MTLCPVSVVDLSCFCTQSENEVHHGRDSEKDNEHRFAVCMMGYVDTTRAASDDRNRSRYMYGLTVLFLAVKTVNQSLDRGFELIIDAACDVAGIVIYLDVGVELMVFEHIAVHVH